MSASVNLPLHHKVQKFSSGTGSPGWSRKKGRKTVVVKKTEEVPTDTDSPEILWWSVLSKLTLLLLSL